MLQYTRSANEQFFKEHLEVGWPWHMFLFTLILLLSVTLGYFGLHFGYRPYLLGSIADTESKLIGLALGVEKESQDNFVTFYSQIANVKTLLANHVTTSKLFPLLESVTHQKIVYTSTNLILSEKTLKIEGLAQSYEVISAQLVLYEGASWVEKVILDSSSLGDKSVKFSVRLKLKNEILNL